MFLSERQSTETDWYVKCKKKEKNRDVLLRRGETA